MWTIPKNTIQIVFTMKKLQAILLLIGLFYSPFLHAQEEKSEDFNFVFMTDIHLEHGRRAQEGFLQAIDTANKLSADFALTGGDLISDALEARHSQADSLYLLYTESVKAFGMPVYNTVGNHELYGLYRKSGADTLHPDYNDGMYKRYLGDSYYSFDHKGWHFIVLNSIIDAHGRYQGFIDDEQVDWLKKDLAKTDSETPIIISSHIPFISSYNQLKNGTMAPNDEGLIVCNSKEILTMFSGHNLKLVLQGHLHIVEHITYHTGIHFLIGGAVSAHWWWGPNVGMEEGFMLIKIRSGNVEWEYIDYGFEVEK